MRIKTLLLSVVLGHICTATFNDTVTMAKGIVNGFPSGAVVNITDEASEEAFSAMNDWNSTLDQRRLNNLRFLSDIDLSYRDPLVTRFMPSFYILIVLFSLPLNSLALVAFTFKIREKKPAVIYMSHLACADLLFALLLPLKIHYQFNSFNWIFGEAACRVLTAAYYCYMYSSILLMMCMSVDRMLGVAFPIVSLTWRSARKATLVCILVWLLALIGSVPFLFMQLRHVYYDFVTCLDTYFEEQFSLYMYMLSNFLCMSFFLPLIITLVSYFTIIYVLLVKSNNTASSSSSSSSDKRKRAIIMAIAVLTEFVVCFGPSNVILMWICSYSVTGMYNMKLFPIYYDYLVASCFGSASVFLSPLLYYYGSSQCRNLIRSLLRR